jgi:acetyl-CoA carboxylase biotin carboxyl carrier protein
MDLKEIQELIRILGKSNVAELRIERDNFKITLRTRDFYTENRSGAPHAQTVLPVAAPFIPSVAPATTAAVTSAENKPREEAVVSSDANLITIKSPMIGTFYRSSGPDKEPFVKVGDEIKPGSVLCVIEAMKLFNEIESEYSGKIVKILVENAKPVEYDQPLFLIEPM